MRTLKITLQYDGTDYVGWQRQASGISIQGLIEDALRPIEGNAVVVHGAGRTDAGVHALAQICSCTLTVALDTSTLARALNAVLPPDVRVARVEDAAPGFHARFEATGKLYHYRIVNAPYVSPFIRRFAWHVIPPLDLEAMQTAASALAGQHDFAAFQGTGVGTHATVRTIRHIAVTGERDPEHPIVVAVEGDGFLRHMVRNIAGTLAEIGARRWPPEDMRRILESGDRTRAGRTAPPQGLFLVKVCY